MRMDRTRQASDVSVIVGLGERDGDALALRDTEMPSEMLRDVVGALLALRDLLAATLALREAERVRDGDRVGDTSLHCTYSAKTAPGGPQPPDTASVP
jgi:hypothetical protein